MLYAFSQIPKEGANLFKNVLELLEQILEISLIV